MNTETIILDTVLIDEIINSANSKINTGGGFNKTSALNSFSSLTSLGIGGNLISSICTGLESMNTCISQITKDLKEYSDAQEKIDDEIIEASVPFTEDFSNENLFSPVAPQVTGTESTGTEKVASTYTDENIEVKAPVVDNEIKLTDIKTPTQEEIKDIAGQLNSQTMTTLSDITSQPIEEVTSVTDEQLIDALDNTYINQINNGTYQDLIDFEYDNLNITNSVIKNISAESSYSELLDFEVSLFYEYLKEICSKLNISSITNLTENESLLNILIQNYETNNVNVKLSSFSNDLIISKINGFETR